MSASKKSWQKGVVHWFDEMSGEGMIKDENGTSYYVHSTAIDSDKPRKSLRDKKKVKFKTVEDITFTQVVRVKEL